jgi:hypothetical protein
MNQVDKNQFMTSYNNVKSVIGPLDIVINRSKRYKGDKIDSASIITKKENINSTRRSLQNIDLDRPNSMKSLRINCENIAKESCFNLCNQHYGKSYKDFISDLKQMSTIIKRYE